MAAHSGSNISEEGLVVAYDMSSTNNSFKGRPMSSLTRGITVAERSVTGHEVVGSTETVNIPEIGDTEVTVANIYNHYNSFTPNSGSCCPSPIRYDSPGQINLQSSTLYTYMILYKVDSGYAHPNFMYRYEYNASGTKLTEGGVHSTSTSKRTSLGNGWYYAWNTFTTQSTTTRGNFSLFYYRYSDTFDKIYVANAVIAEGNYSGMHPKYWPKPQEARSSTQSLLDWTGTTNLTSLNLEYLQDGTFTFVQSNDSRVNIDDPGFFNSWDDEFTFEFMMRVPAGVDWCEVTSSSGTAIIGRGSYGGSQMVIRPNVEGRITFWIRDDSVNSISISGLARDTWYHVVATYNSSGRMDFYLDGELRTFRTMDKVGVPDSGGYVVGGGLAAGGTNGGYVSGDYPVMRIYDRAISSKEVRHNYLAYKKRFI